MTTKPKGIHATFSVDCPVCGQEATVTNGNLDDHYCQITTLADIAAALRN